MELTKTFHTYPRDELFQITDDDLFAISMGIVALGERQRVRLFARTDPYRRFVSCLVFVPRDRYNTDNRERIASVLSDAFGATEIEWSIRLSDSKLARLHYIVRCSNTAADHDLDAIERRIATVTRPWSGHLADALRDVHGEERGSGTASPLRGSVPNCLPRRLASTGGSSRHRPCRGSRSRQQVCDQHVSERRRRPDVAALQAVEPGRADRALGRLADLREHGLAGQRRASVRDQADRTAIPSGCTTLASIANSTSTSVLKRRARSSKTPSRVSGWESPRTTGWARWFWEPA